MSATEQQRQEHLESVRIQRVGNGYIVRIPLEGVNVFHSLQEAFECVEKFYGKKGVKK